VARLLFPQDRTAFVYLAAGKPILAPGPDYRATVYLDEACTVLADILDLNEVAIPGSVLTVDVDTLIPEFLGPENVTRLWTKALPGNRVYVMDAQVDDRLDTLMQMITDGDFTGPQGPPGDTGVSEDDVAYDVETDTSTPGTTYVGQADPGSSTASAVWRIRRITETNDGASVDWADGVGTFVHIWDDRASLTYGP